MMNPLEFTPEHSLILERIKRRIQKEGKDLYEVGLGRDERLNLIKEKALEFLYEEGIILSRDQLQGLLSRLFEDIVGLGPLEPLLKDEEITEIMINGPDQVYIEREGRLHLVPMKFRDQEHLYYLIEKILGPLGLRVDESSPYVDARLMDGSRVNVIIPPLSLKGPLVTIRKFSRHPLTMQSLIDGGMLSIEIADFLKDAVAQRLNVVISGGAGSGKTTLLNALSAFIPRGERIITIEDAAELRLQQEHVLPLEARPPNLEGKGEITVRDLLRNALRMRPDRIIVGEVRGGEALDMLQAMNTGHEGSLSTVHANSPLECLYRLETMAFMANMGLPAHSISAQIKNSIDLIIHVARVQDGTRRLMEICEIDPDNEHYSLRPLFSLELDHAEGQLLHRRKVDPLHLKQLCRRRRISMQLEGGDIHAA
jgi:pilus assembly protein CpaF